MNNGPSAVKMLPTVISQRFVLVVIFFFLAASPSRVQSAGVFPSKDSVSKWVAALEESFRILTTGNGDVTGATLLQQQYQASLNGQFGIKKANGEQVTSELAQKISDLFARNIKALKNLQKTAETAVKDYTYNPNLILNNTEYINVNELKSGPKAQSLKYDPHFRQEINGSESGVHIPIEIYEGYPDILNGITWSRQLDSAFKKNREDDPEIYWQSFGAQDGFMRIYPAARWQTVDNMPDLFDVRRRPWYIHGSATPKDVILLLDTSGSMHGQSFDIMKLAAKTLLNTLGENDYVNVAQFSRNVTWVTPCLDTLVQANSRNKRLLFDGIDKLEDHQIASYAEALTFAYKEFEKFETAKDGQDGAECHKLIFVFSDGGTEYPKQVIDKYTNFTSTITKDVRIFSYAVGPHPLPTVALKNIACNTGGSFNMITAMGAIRTKIQDYARVLSKPLVLDDPEFFYNSVPFSQDQRGLGLVTTVTLPVFNTSSKSDGQTLAGVVGIDIPVSKFEELTPRHQLGPLGYSFGVNQNGFLVFHPGLWMDANYLEDPSHIDLNDMEGEDPVIINLRKRMVDKADKTPESLSNPKPLDVEARVPIKAKRVYRIAKIEGSAFTLGVAQDENWNYLEIPANTPLQPIKELEGDQTLLAQWKYCSQKTEADLNVTVGTVQNALDGGLCNTDLARHLAWDAQNAKKSFGRTAENRDNAKSDSNFFTSDGGLTLFSPPSSKPDYEAIAINPYNSSMYRLAVSNQKPRIFIKNFISKDLTTRFAKRKRKHFGVLVVTDINLKEPLFFKVKPSIVHLTSPVIIEQNGQKYTAGVAGANLKPSFLQQLLLKASSSSTPDEVTCERSEDIVCYLMDESGLIISSNQDLVKVEPGDFLGVVDPLLMKELNENIKIFDQQEDWNYQDLCPDELECCSLGVRSVIIPTLNTLVYVIQNIGKILENIGYVMISFLSFIFLPRESEAVSEYGFRIPEGLHRCTTKTLTFFLKEPLNRDEYHEKMIGKCADALVECKRDYHLYRLKTINAVLIVADAKCKSCYVEPYMNGPQEVKQKNATCQLPKRYRKRPEECFATNPNEIPECSGVANLVSESIILIGLLSSLFLFR